jgi:2-oxoglutarate dehydrogenase E2 component (dihydrolipoamide succinyltransferase)
MSEKIVVPVLGESITEATVAKWLKNTGDAVEVDESLVELETDKVNLEVPSPVKGILTEINSKDGSVVEVGALLGLVSESKSMEPVKNEKIKKVEPTLTEDNIIKLDPSKKEPKIFEEKKDRKYTG